MYPELPDLWELLNPFADANLIAPQKPKIHPILHFYLRGRENPLIARISQNNPDFLSETERYLWKNKKLNPQLEADILMRLLENRYEI